MEWANAELEHVGRVAAVEDPGIQYAYAMSTVNGMLHLRQALKELIVDDDYKAQRRDLEKTHDNVVRVIKHMIKDYGIDIETIKKFNTKKIIGNYSFLKGGMPSVVNKNKSVKCKKAIKNNTRRNKLSMVL
jgi:hypothetical protein